MIRAIGKSIFEKLKPIPTVTSLPSNGNYVGRKVYFDKYNHITSTAIPSTLGQGYVLESAYGNKQIRGVKCAELNGPDTLICPIQSGDLIGAGTWKVEFIALDGSATYTTSADLILFRNASNTTMLKVQCFNSGKYVFGLCNGATVVRYVTSTQNQTQQLPTKFTIEYTGSAINLTVNGETISISDVSGWTTYTGCKDILLSDFQSTIRPLQINDVAVYRAGALTDYWYCNEGTGTSVSNSVSPSRVGTLSDANAWGQGYTIEPEIYKTVWQWLGAVWERAYPHVYAFADLDYADPALTGLDRLYTDADNFAIVDINGQPFGQHTLAPGELWTSPDTGGQSARSEIRLKNGGNHGKTYEYGMDIFIDNSHGESASWTILSQHNKNPDPTIGESWTGFNSQSPNISLKYQAGNLRVGVITNFTAGTVTDIIAVPFSKGVKHTILMKVKWSTGNDGSLEIWLDGIALEASGQTKYVGRTSYNFGPTDFRVGIYRDGNILEIAKIAFSNVFSRLV